LPPPKRKKGKPRGRPFPKGVSGNPGGRPRTVKEVQELASEYTEEALLKLVAVMRVKPTGYTLKEIRQAAVAILDRACGRPSQPLTGKEGEPLEAEFPNLLATLKKLSGDGDADPEAAEEAEE